MLGVHGLDPFGLVHALLGLVALTAGLCVLLLRKGTLIHRRIGVAYVAAMVSLNLTALWIFDLTGRLGPFHVAAIISLATVVAGYVPVLRRQPLEWIHVHGIFMAWSYVGLVAAFFAEIAVRVPGVDFSAGVIAATIVATAAGAILIHTRVPVIAQHLMRARS